ncbi:hypothetical protein RUM44_003575 [Polyplax serrata]|uniref:Sugar phosphate phosphatase n=1 Tax=Polyplax serrata TaxID=468196 RepID=A0ABR1AGU7_POLSC
MQRQQSIAFEGRDSETPLNEKLSAKYIRSFAYYTVKDRLPVILTKVINDLVTNKSRILQEHNKDEVEEDLKSIIGKISKLKNELVTNKTLVKLNSKGDDITSWNDYLDLNLNSETEQHCWYYSPWLLVECYMYRRLWEVVENSEFLQDLDPFACKKEEAFYMALNEIKTVAKSCLTTLKGGMTEIKDTFIKYLKLSLWSNHCDLSLSNGNQISGDECSTLTQLNSLDSFLLCEDSLKVFKYLEKNPGGVIDFVTDNAGYEAYCDFCFCDLLCTSSLVSKIRFHVKKLPWYVSDLTRNDIKWMLDRLEKEGISELSARWKKYFDDGVWSIYEENYWTMPFGYKDMKTKDLELYNYLSQSCLVIFKGDLNYRKLLDDINWSTTENFGIVLRDFKPSSILTLRTIKSDVVCGLPPGKSDQLSEKDKMWMRTGDYAVIQFYEA